MNDTQAQTLGLRLEAPGATPNAEILRGVISDEEIEALRERNAARLIAEQKRLGSRWVMYETRKEAA
ncbi:MAG: hypothetical protein KA151_08590 [Piscinibacter sp.]|nr:hypothetical protein [Piscinibacter sp.]